MNQVKIKRKLQVIFCSVDTSDYSSKFFNWLSLEFALILQANWLRFNRQHLECFLTVSYQALAELGRYLHKQDAF